MNSFVCFVKSPKNNYWICVRVSSMVAAALSNISFKNVDVCGIIGSESDWCRYLFEFQGVGMRFWGEDYNWLLSRFFVYCMPLLYLVGSIGLFFVVEGMDIRIPKGLLKVWMGIYNVCQIGLCGYMVAGLLPLWKPLSNPFALYLEPDATAEWYIFVHGAISKYLDYFDTFFMIVNRKSYAQLSWLHLLHHSSISSVWQIMLKDGVGNRGMLVGALKNSIIHTLLYSHYLVTSFGINNPLKKWLTRLQLLQFAFLFIQACAFVVFKDPVWDYAIMQVFYQAAMLYLFGWHMNWFPWFVNKYSMNPNNIKKS